jgi:hypothetical protein
MQATPRKEKLPAQIVVSLDSLTDINLNAAGLDMGAAEMWACVHEGWDAISMRDFAPLTADLHTLADGLNASGVEPLDAGITRLLSGYERQG